MRFSTQLQQRSLAKQKKTLQGEDFGFPLSSGKVTEIEIFRNGSPLTAEMAAGEIQWQGAAAYVVSIRDITHKRRIQELKKIAKIHEEYGHILSHEMRNPLAILQSAAEIIGTENLSQQQQRKIYSIIKSNVVRMTHVIDHALLLARLEQEDVRAHRRLTHLHTLLESLVQEVQPLVERENLKLITQISHEAPPTLLVENLMSQAVLNLLQNALRYAETKIWVKMAPLSLKEGQYLEVQVGNDGSIIDQEDQKKLFHKFVRLSNKQKRGTYKGTGLGLALCKRIVEKHGGCIDVHSSPKSGTLFSIRLPLHHSRK